MRAAMAPEHVAAAIEDRARAVADAAVALQEARAPVPARKHRSCESGLEATGRPCSAAIARTRSFVSSPSGKRIRAIVCGDMAGEHVRLVLGGIGGAQQPSSVTRA